MWPLYEQSEAKQYWDFSPENLSWTSNPKAEDVTQNLPFF